MFCPNPRWNSQVNDRQEVGEDGVYKHQVVCLYFNPGAVFLAPLPFLEAEFVGTAVSLHIGEIKAGFAALICLAVTPVFIFVHRAELVSYGLTVAAWVSTWPFRLDD